MFRTLITSLTVVTLAFMVSCARKASQDDLQKVCAHKLALQQASNPEEAAKDPVAKAVEKFKAEEEALAAEQKEELEKLDEECQAAKETIDSAEDVQKADADCNAKRNALLADFGKRAEQLKQDREEAVNAATEEKARADLERAEQVEKALTECVNLLLKARTSSAKADCLLKAATLEAFGQCR